MQSKLPIQDHYILKILQFPFKKHPDLKEDLHDYSNFFNDTNSETNINESEHSFISSSILELEEDLSDDSLWNFE